MHQDERPAGADREPVPVQAEREPERDRGGAERVRDLPRVVLPDPGGAGDERVDGLVEPQPAELDAAQERLCVRDRGRARERGDGVDPALLAREDVPAQERREAREDPPERRADDVTQRLGLVGVAAIRAGQPRQVEHERQPDHRQCSGDRLLDLEDALPLGEAGRLDERGGPCEAAHGRGVARRPERSRAAVENGLRGSDDDDEIGLDDRAVHARSLREWHERLVLRIVHGDASPERASPRRREQALELALAIASSQAACDEERQLRVGDPAGRELVDRRGERRRAWILLRPGHRERRRLDDDRRTRSRPRESRERPPGEREPQRVADRRRDVDDLVRRRRWRQDDVLLGGRDEGDPGAGEHGNAAHAGIQAPRAGDSHRSSCSGRARASARVPGNSIASWSRR